MLRYSPSNFQQNPILFQVHLHKHHYFHICSFTASIVSMIGTKKRGSKANKRQDTSRSK